VLLVALLSSGRARAAGEDAALSATVQKVLDEEYAQASYAAGKTKIAAALDKCKAPKAKCSGPTKASAYVALGMIASQIGQADEAKSSFVTALTEDPNAKLPSSGTSPSIRAQFAEAQKTAAPPPPPPTPLPTPTPTPVEAPEENPNVATPTPLAVTPVRAPPGWTSPEAFQLASAGVAADLAGKLDQCIDKDLASLKIEEQPRTRLHLASCENRLGKLLDALKDAQTALKLGIERRDSGVMTAARQRVQNIIPRIPHVTFIPPAGVNDLKVKFDDRPVPSGALTKKFSIDPGKHEVHADGTQNGVPLAYDEEFTVQDGELLTVTITLKSQAPEFLTPGQLKCMLSAKSQEDVQKCLPQNAKNLVIRAGLEIAGYTDTNHVHVASPGMTASITSPTAGWNVAGSYLVDFVTAASPDIVSMASRHFRETRHAASVSGGYKPGLFGASAHANVSSEPDYRSLSAGGAITGDFNDKLVTPRLAYSHSDDTIGKRDTSFDVFHNQLFTNEFEASVTVVMSPTSVLMVGGTLSTERGDQSKLYRYVPTFSPALAGRIPTGATVDLVNFYRLPIRPVEQLPTERDRYALAARFMHRFPTATLRLDQRLYNDTWGTKATTTDMRYIQDLGRYLRVWPHVRFNAQSGTNFYQLAYSAVVSSDGKVTVPTYRSGDRELAPMITLTAGGGTRIALGSPEASTQYGITLSGDLMYSRFLNSLFVTTRTAIYGALGFEAEFQ
jgi:hypothetical protein